MCNTKQTCNRCAYYKPEYQECTCPKFVYSGDSDGLDEDGLQYWDYEIYSAGFRVGPKFGCIHWMPLPAPPTLEDV